MSNTELIKFESTDVSAIDFDSFEAYLENALETYRNNVYTEESAAAAKEDKAELNKLKKLIEDKRKEYKAQCLAPYEAVEYRFKALVAMIEEQRELIDSSLKNIDDKKKTDRETALRKYYDEKSAPLGKYAERMYKRIFSERWLRGSYSLKKCEEEIIVAVNSSVRDIEKLRQLKSPFADEIIDQYISGSSFEAAVAKNEELINAVQKAGVNVGASKAVVVQEIEDKADSDDGFTVKIKGTKHQLEQVVDFMKIMGIEHEVI